jgi:DNA-binding MarR family transcriptional regulator
MPATGITIELTRSQVDRVVRHGSHAGPGVSVALRGLSNGGLASSFASLSASPRLSRSLLLGLLVLACFPADGEALAVTDVAGRLDLSPSTTHRYMSTLLAVGLLEQDPRTRRYHVPVSV